jgi:diguanylate cyclase (GGDEF)-like protein
MRGDDLVFSLPRGRVTGWLADAGPGVSDEVRGALIRELHGTWTIFAAGVINSVIVAAAIALRQQTAPFIAWLALELTICIARLIILIRAHRAARAHRPTPTDLYILFTLAWGGSVGMGAGLSLMSGDWISATLACLSAAAMVGGTCFRNFSAPRLAGAMMLSSIGPVIPAIIYARQPLLYVLFLQMPLYFVAMIAATFRLNKMLVAVMHSKRRSEDLARHDPLTGVRNRAGFVDAIDAKLADGSGSQSFALLYLDLDHFKPVNDNFGHAAGDSVLRTIARSLRDVLPAADAIARIGGDEFVVLTCDVTADEAVAIAERIISVITAPITLADGNSVTIGVSIGVAISPDHGSDAETLLALADAALYEAKSSGKSCCRVASTDTILAALRRLAQRGAADAAA